MIIIAAAHYALMLSGYLMTKLEFERLPEEAREQPPQAESGTRGGFDVAAPFSCIATAWNWFMPERPLHNYPGKAVGALLGYGLAKFHLLVVDRRYLERGRLSRLLGLGNSAST